MPKNKSKKPKGMTPEQVAKANRDNIDYAMQANPMLQFGDIRGNSNDLMGDLLGTALPIMDGFISMGSSATGQAAPDMSMMDILAQMQPPPQQQPQPGQPQMQPPPQQQPQPGQPAVGQPPQMGANPYGLTPQQMAHINQNVRGPGRGIV